jgi:hypothetical protein
METRFFWQAVKNIAASWELAHSNHTAAMSISFFQQSTYQHKRPFGFIVFVIKVPPIAQFEYILNIRVSVKRIFHMLDFRSPAL